jgi:glycerol kinase
MWRQAARYEPSMSEDAREELLAGWARALARARSNKEDRSG